MTTHNPPRDLDPDELDRLAGPIPITSGRRRKPKSPPAADLSDDTLALRFAAENADLLRYVKLRGQWLRWDGQRWLADSTGHTFNDMRTMLRSMGVSDKDRKAVLSAKTVAAVERLARVDRRLAATVDQWDRDDWILNTPGGIVDLRTGEIRQHDPAAYLTKITAAAPGGTCPLWYAFIEDVTGQDSDLAAFIQRVAGYALTGTTREHALFFFYGTGGNGKGVLLNTLTGALGDYVKVAGMATFVDSHSDQHPTDLAALQGARLVVAQETEEGRRWAESRIKAMTGGDPITARFMRQDFFTYSPKFKLLIAGNHKPRLRSVDEAIRRRLHLVPFTVTIPPERRDLELTEKLKAEWPGILQWAVDGCRAYLSQGLAPPAAVRDATTDYFGAQDLFGEWVEDCCEQGDEHWETPSRTFASWKGFADQRNERPGTQAQFRDRMEAAGFRQGRDRNRGRYWSGIRVHDAPVDEGSRYGP